MLLNLREYHRPGTLATSDGRRQAMEQALELLAQQDIHTVPLAGGDTLLGSTDPAVEAVVDLQALGLDTIEWGSAVVEIGAMVTRGTLVEDADIQQLQHGILSGGAHRWSGAEQRNRATVGGAVVVAASTDLLVAALLACDAEVVLYGTHGYHAVPLVDYLRQGNRPFRGHAATYSMPDSGPQIVARLRVPLSRGASGAASATVARTAADTPIVLAVATLAFDDDICKSARLVIGGMDGSPQRLPAVESELTGSILTADRLASAARKTAELVEPPNDYRASAEYRRAMAATLSERALRQAWARAA